LESSIGWPEEDGPQKRAQGNAGFVGKSGKRDRARSPGTAAGRSKGGKAIEKKGKGNLLCLYRRDEGFEKPALRELD